MVMGDNVLRPTWPILACCLLAGALAAPAAGQSYRESGVSPIFDGWEELPDGSRMIYFGYINRQPTEVDIPVGAGNDFEPGAADRGQPTHFLQGRHEHVFTVKVPRDMTGKVVWTIRTAVGVQTANASFDQLYILAEHENQNPNAKPPAVDVVNLNARVGEPVALTPRITTAANSGRTETEGGVAEAVGLNVAWSKYRGPGAVVFAAHASTPPVAPSGAGRGRAGRQTAPRQGIHAVNCGLKPTPACGAVMAMFKEPGVYLLRIAARQDGLEGLGFVQVTVTR